MLVNIFLLALERQSVADIPPDPARETQDGDELGEVRDGQFPKKLLMLDHPVGEVAIGIGPANLIPGIAVEEDRCDLIPIEIDALGAAVAIIRAFMDVPDPFLSEPDGPEVPPDASPLGFRVYQDHDNRLSLEDRRAG
jgi:hypothetical protein